MTPVRKSGGANVAVANVRRRSGGGWVGASFVKRRSGGSWVTVYTATPPPYTPISSVTIIGNTNIFQPQNGGGTTTLTASANGSGTKTYAWTKLSGGTALNISGTATSASVFITDSTPNNTFLTHTATFRCTVSDGTSSAYSDVTVTCNGAQ